jgi:folate-dependent phosphoribosylglycinamide formyltransferase PurN
MLDTTPKLVVITNGNFFARIILSDLFEQHSDWISGVLLISGDYKGRTGVKSLFELSKVTALPYIFYKMMSIAYFRMASLLDPTRTLDVKTLALRKNVPIKEVTTIKSFEASDWIQNLCPDLIVSVSSPQLISEKILNFAQLGGINIHSSLLPKYAGLAPYFWVLANGEQTTGTTIHYMTAKFDQGNILEQVETSIEPNESAFHLFFRLAKLGRSSLTAAIQRALQEDPGNPQNLENFSYFSNPTISAYNNLRKNGHVLMRLSELSKALNEMNASFLPALANKEKYG